MTAAARFLLPISPRARATASGQPTWPRAACQQESGQGYAILSRSTDTASVLPPGTLTAVAGNCSIAPQPLRNDEDAGRTTQLGAPDGNTEVITGGTSDIGFAAGGDDHTCTL